MTNGSKSRRVIFKMSVAGRLAQAQNLKELQNLDSQKPTESKIISESNSTDSHIDSKI